MRKKEKEHYLGYSFELLVQEVTSICNGKAEEDMEEAEEKEEVEEEMEGGEPIKIGFGQRHMIVTMNYHDMQPFFVQSQLENMPPFYFMIVLHPSLNCEAMRL